MVRAEIDGAVSLYYDASTYATPKLATTSTGIDVTGGFTATDGCTITTADNTAQLTLVSTDADSNFGPVIKMYRNSSSPADADFLGDIEFQGENSAGETITYAQVFGRTGDVTDGTEDGRIATKIMVAGVSQNVLDIKSDEIVINDDSVDLDFRIESDGDTHALFVDASTNRVGISTSAPPVQFTVGGGDGTAELLLWGNNANTTSSRLIFGGQDPYTSEFIQFRYDSDSNLLQLETETGFGVGKIVQFDRQYGRVTFNEDSAADADFRVESNNNTHMLFVDGGNNKVGIGVSSPVALVDIGGAQSDESLMLRSGDNNVAASGGKQILFGFNNSASYAHNIRTRHDSNNQANNTISFYTWQPTQSAGDYGNARIADFSSDGVVFNEDSRDADFRVESDSNSNMFVVDAGNNRVGVGGSPGKTFEVTGEASIFGSPYASNGDRAKLFLGNRNANIGAIFGSGLYFDSGNGAGDAMTIAQSSGAVTIAGSLSKGSGSFKISHPLSEKNETHHLVHSFVEAPQADNIYRGKVDLIAGQATVNIDTVAGMTEGTFVALNREVQCFTSNETGWTAVRGSVTGNILTIEAQDNTCADTISWLVIGERKDQHMYDTEWTDENGKVIVEPLKEQQSN